MKKIDAKKLFSGKSLGTYLFIGIIALAVLFGLRFALIRPMANSLSNGVVPAQILTTPINRDFSIKVYDKNKKLADPIQYTLTDAQLTNKIVIKGQAATAVKGRAFLILNLKLVNNSNQSLFLNTRNYVRVQPAGTQDRLAPDIHNDTVEAQPLSTKLTRIGLPVDENVKDFTLFVGEIDGAKEEISIKF